VKYRRSKNCRAQELSEAKAAMQLARLGLKQLLEKSSTAMLALFNSLTLLLSIRYFLQRSFYSIFCFAQVFN